MGHFECRLNRRFGVQKSCTSCPNWGVGGNLDKIQKNSNFFSWNLPIGLTKYFDFLIKCICILRFFNGKLRQDYESYYSYFLLLTAWIEEKSWNGHNYIIWPPPTVHYVVIPGSQNVHQHHCWLLGVRRGCLDWNSELYLCLKFLQAFLKTLTVCLTYISLNHFICRVSPVPQVSPLSFLINNHSWHMLGL